MDVWDEYVQRLNVHGNTKREAVKKRETRYLQRKLPDSLSYQNVGIYLDDYSYNVTSDEAQENRIEQNVAIIDSDNLNEKYIYSLPEEDIILGSLVHWMDNYWIVDERDANTTLYTRAKIIQCNYLLKWINSNKEIVEQWCVVEDGTKYLTGEYEDRDFVVTRGDTRISVELAKNKETSVLDRNTRFIIDDPSSTRKLAYILSKPLKTGLTYNNQGVFKFVLQEVTATKYDNMDLHIADYYKAFPDPSNTDPDLSGKSDNTTIGGKDMSQSTTGSDSSSETKDNENTDDNGNASSGGRGSWL